MVRLFVIIIGFLSLLYGGYLGFLRFTDHEEFCKTVGFTNNLGNIPADCIYYYLPRN